jgi:hypothetical protein
MDDGAVDNIKTQLDKELESVDPNHGIAFSEELFAAFRQRRWIELKVFGILGTSFGGTKLPAYGSHYAFPTWDLKDGNYKVGHDATRP